MLTRTHTAVDAEAVKLLGMYQASRGASIARRLKNFCRCGRIALIIPNRDLLYNLYVVKESKCLREYPHGKTFGTLATTFEVTEIELPASAGDEPMVAECSGNGGGATNEGFVSLQSLLTLSTVEEEAAERMHAKVAHDLPALDDDDLRTFVVNVEPQPLSSSSSSTSLLVAGAGGANDEATLLPLKSTGHEQNEMPLSRRETKKLRRANRIALA